MPPSFFQLLIGLAVAPPIKRIEEASVFGFEIVRRGKDSALKNQAEALSY
jgi:hypothetical protein